MELIAFAALLACALIVGAAVFALALLSSSSALPPLDAAAISVLYTLILGALPLGVVGAPIFALLHYHGRASWGAVLTLGITPGVLLGIFLQDSEVAVMGVTCGAAAASSVRAICGRGPNKSLNTDAGKASAG